MDELKQTPEREAPALAEAAAASAAEPAEAPAKPGCCGGCPCAAEPLPETVDDALAAELLAPAPADEAPAPEQPQRVTVVDIHFRTGGKVYFFDPDGLELKPGDHVIIDTARGAEYGICASGCHTVGASEIVAPSAQSPAGGHGPG